MNEFLTPTVKKYLIYALLVVLGGVLGHYGIRVTVPPPPPEPEVVLKAAVSPAESVTNRRPLVNLVIRQQIAAKLVEAGVPKLEARKRAYEVLQDETIDAVAAEVLVANDLAGGSVIDWIKLHWEDILAIVLKLLPLLLLV